MPVCRACGKELESESPCMQIAYFCSDECAAAGESEGTYDRVVENKPLKIKQGEEDDPAFQNVVKAWEDGGGI